MGIIRASKICSVIFSKTFPANGVGFIVRKDASCAVVGHVDVVLVADISKVEAPDDICTDRFNFVAFTPIYIGTTGDAGGVEYMGRLDL